MKPVNSIKLHALLLIFVAATLCSSCLYSRLLSFKKQLASFGTYVSLADGGSTLRFYKPVVEADDITSLTGFQPTSMQKEPGGRMLHIYKYRSLSPTGLTGTPCTLCFTLNYGPDGLASFHYPSQISQILGTNLVIAAAKAVGQSSFNKSEYKLDWSTQSTNIQAMYIPSQARLMQVLGAALTYSNTPSGTVASYTFNLERPDGNLKTNGIMSAVFLFDQSNSLLRKGIIHIGKLALTVELPALP